MKWVLLILAVGLAGCEPNPGPVQIKIKYVHVKAQPECLTDEPVWIAPDPKMDETRSHAAWRDNANHGSFDALAKDHATCKASQIEIPKSKDPKNG